MNKKIKAYFFTGIIALWVIYTIFYYLFKQNINTQSIAGYLSMAGESGLDFILMVLCAVLWKKTSNQIRSIFGILTISFLAAFLADSIYNLVLNVFQITKFSEITTHLFELPFLLFLVFQAICWSYAFFSMRPKEKMATKYHFLIYVPSILISLFIFFSFIFQLIWTIQITTTEGIYQLLDTIAEAFGFIFAILCISSAVTFFLRCIATGYLFIVASDFLIRANVVTNTLLPNIFWETTWVLGLILIFYGLIIFYSESTYKRNEFLLYSTNSLQPKIAAWNNILGIIFLFAFFMIEFIFSPLDTIKPNQELIKILPSIVIIFSIVLTTISAFFSRVLLSYIVE